MEPTPNAPKMTDLEAQLLRSIRNLYVWVNDGCPGISREAVLTAAQKAIEAGEAKELS